MYAIRSYYDDGRKQTGKAHGSCSKWLLKHFVSSGEGGHDHEETVFRTETCFFEIDICPGGRSLIPGSCEGKQRQKATGLAATATFIGTGVPGNKPYQEIL